MLTRSCPRDTWRPPTLHHSAHHGSRLANLRSSRSCNSWVYLLPHRHSRLLSTRHTLMGRVSMDHRLSSMSNASVAAHARVCSKWLCHGHLCHAQSRLRIRVRVCCRICRKAFASRERVESSQTVSLGGRRVFVARSVGGNSQDVTMYCDYAR